MGVRHERFVAYLSSLRGRYAFEFVDLTRVESFGGDPDDFCDGVHIKEANARRIIDLFVRTFPETFKR